MQNNTLLNYNVNDFVSKAEDIIVSLLVFLFRPIVHNVYGKYQKFNKLSNKRKNYVLKSYLCKTVTICAILIIGVFIALGTSFFEQKISAQDNEILHKYYTSVTIEPGDTLWNIADDFYAEGYDSHADYIDEVMHINHLESKDEIVSGTTLVIPYYSYEVK